jgi:hypothetical protein
MFYRTLAIVLSAFLAAFAASCSQPATNAPESKAQNTAVAAAPTPSQSQSAQATPKQPATAQRAPGKGFTPADVAKLKWLQGSWHGTGAPKPFYNRYRVSATALDIEGFDDEAMTKKTDSAHYELKDGMFLSPEGKDRFAASEITDDYIQFVTLTGTSEAFRMERVGDGTVKAIVEGTGPDGNPYRLSYILEPLKK